jgi:hypothetical protein
MGVEPDGGGVVSLPILILVWLGGNAVIALAALLFGWLRRREARATDRAYTVWIYQPGLQDDYTDRVIAEAFFAVPEFMEKVREEEL